MQLPFGNIPFTKSVPTTSASAADHYRPSATIAINTKNPTPPPATERKERDKKRDGAEIPKGPNKKGKTVNTEGEPPLQLVTSTFGSLASNHFSDDDAKMFMKRNNNDAEFAFKMGLGEAFYHGLNLLTEKNMIISDQEKTAKKLKGEASTLKTQLLETQKRLDVESKTRKDEVERLQGQIDTLAMDSKIEGEASKKENERLQSELDELKASKDRELSEAYNLGFLAYLRNFLAADPDYNWSMHFAPSTFEYMEGFKADNVKAIEEARKEHHKKVEAELKAKDEAKRVESTPENRTGASPSNATAL